DHPECCSQQPKGRKNEAGGDHHPADDPQAGLKHGRTGIAEVEAMSADRAEEEPEQIGDADRFLAHEDRPRTDFRASCRLRCLEAFLVPARAFRSEEYFAAARHLGVLAAFSSKGPRGHYRPPTRSEGSG